MQPPKLEKIVTREGIIYRVTYAGMVKDHKRDWQATNFYWHLCQCYVLNLVNKRG
jgi:hypothetical protein